VISGDRRGDAGELEVEASEGELRRLRLELALGGTLVGDCPLELPGARGAGGSERLIARDLGVGACELRPEPRLLAFGAEHGRLVLARVDLEQEITDLHQCAGRERHLVDVSRDPGTDVDAFDGGRAPGELERLLHGLGERLAHRHLDRRGPGDLRLPAAAGGEHHRDRP
jgi:hypothetical protein